MQTRQSERVFDEALGQIFCKALPLAAKHHRGQMPASRVANDGDAAGIAAELRDVAIDPCERFDLAHDELLDRDDGAERVIWDHDAGAEAPEAGRDEAVIGFV